MLRLIAAKADGWLPSMFGLGQGDLRNGNRIIDDAAMAAGRDPRDVRRLLNITGTFADNGDGVLRGSPEQWVEQLLPFALDDGVSTFFLVTDDADSIERFGEEVAPALRASVERERSTGGR